MFKVEKTREMLQKLEGAKSYMKSSPSLAESKLADVIKTFQAVLTVKATEQNAKSGEACLYCGTNTMKCEACGGGKLAETNSFDFSNIPGLDGIFGKSETPEGIY